MTAAESRPWGRKRDRSDIDKIGKVPKTDADHETWTAQGYAQYDSATDRWDLFTIVGTISITTTDRDGRVTDQIQATWSGGPLSGLTAANCPALDDSDLTFVAWTANKYANTRLVATAVYYAIPSISGFETTLRNGSAFLGTPSANYDLSTIGYESTYQGGGSASDVPNYKGREDRTESPNGNITRYVLDARGDVLSTWTGTDDTGATDSDPTGGHAAGNNMVEESSETYTPDGQLATLTDADANTTSYTYDALGNEASETTASGTRYYVYNAADELIQETDRDGRVTTYTYDALERETAENWLDGSSNIIATTSYTYDAAGNLLTASSAGTTYTYTYDGLDRVSTVTEVLAGLSAPIVLSYQYDAAGDCTEVAATIDGTPDYVTDYIYDALGRVTSICQFGVTGGDAVAEKRIDLSYDALGRYATITRYADLAGTQLVATATYTFDAAYQLEGLVYKQGTTVLASYVYTYDGDGNVLSMTTLDGTVSYGYNAQDELTAAGSDSYNYDANGNRTTSDGSTYTTGTGNELLDDGTYTYTYDNEGNMLTRTNNSTGEQIDYAWDYRDRLTSVTFYDGQHNLTKTVTYQYDAFNQLVGETVTVTGEAAQGTVYGFDGNQIALQFDKTGTGDLSASDLSHRYLWNSQAVDQLFADEQLSALQSGEGYDQATPGQVVWALTDRENSVRDLATYSNGTTTVQNHRIYDAYGNLTSQTANAAVDCIFGYTGRLFDANTGLQNNLNRWYDPAMGRWMSEDPIAADVNLYRYVHNNPTNALDAHGLCDCPTKAQCDSALAGINSALSQMQAYVTDGHNHTIADATSHSTAWATAGGYESNELGKQPCFFQQAVKDVENSWIVTIASGIRWCGIIGSDCLPGGPGGKVNTGAGDEWMRMEMWRLEMLKNRVSVLCKGAK
jgi:RHS repeat-associated protein